MLELASPIVRVGRVVSFRDAAGNPQDAFVHDDAVSFAAQLYEHSHRLGDYLEKVLPKAAITASIDAVPRQFLGRQVVVRMPDVRVVKDGQEFRLGMSTTVCEEERSSKIWCRVSSDEEVALEPADIKRRYDAMTALAKLGTDALGRYYEDEYNLFVGNGKGRLLLTVEHNYIIEAGDYSSNRLFDVVSTLRETSNLHDVVETDAWHPMYQVLRFADMRLGPKMGISPVTAYERPTESKLIALSDILNEDGRGMSWEVAQGRHGVFAQTEEAEDTTHLAGLCARHSRFPNENDRPDAWIVSGQIADQLGSISD
ncbi:MAG: hypothetical protein JNL14_05865 [Devosia sp.]|uniref:hypothetical protein n=1 Tax=Devosia sp. TaxID=1871048 RepID=UPI001A5BE473|nr:hypothetical protein [Devosia sp.]MBL8597244.1 hypothetical protein [Devosia sp.]